MTKNISHSVKARLLNVAKKRNESYQQIVTRYMQERLLARLAASRFRNNFVLKGGALLFAHNPVSARPTLDLDFMGMNIDSEKDNLIHAFREIISLNFNDGVIFRQDSITTTQIAVEKKYPGIRIAMIATLDSIRQAVSMDIGFGDVVTPYPIEIDYPTILEDFPVINLNAYSLETVVAEKLQTMVDRYLDNSRMKDYYDVWILTSKAELDMTILSEAVDATFRNRRTNREDIIGLFAEEFIHNSDMSMRWNAFLKKMKLSEPDFPTLVEEIHRRISSFIHV